jgi:hypothetical protein
MLASRVVGALVSSAKTVLALSVATDTMCEVLNFVVRENVLLHCAGSS